MSKYNVGLKPLLLQGLSEPEFYGDLVYKFRKIIDRYDCPYYLKKIIVRYLKIGYNIDVLRQTTCLAVSRRLFCFGSLVVLDVAYCYLWLFSLYKIGMG